MPRFREGLISSNENSPDSLLLTCVKFVIDKKVDIRTVSLPQEICDLLVEIYRKKNCNKLAEGDNEEAACTKFFSQFRSSTSRVSQAILADLPITDECLRELLYEQSRNITHLDISNCPNLTSEALEHLKKLFTRPRDLDRIIRDVRLIEDRKGSPKKRTRFARYEAENGTLTLSDSENVNGTQVITVGKLENDFSLYDHLGVLRNPSQSGSKRPLELDDEYGLDLSKNTQLIINVPEKAVVSLSGTSELQLQRDEVEEDSLEFMQVDETEQTPSGSPTLSTCSSTLSTSVSPHHSLLDLSALHDPSVPNRSIYMNGSTLTTQEVSTWQRSNLQSLIVGNSIHIFPEYPKKSTTGDEWKDYLINPHLELRKLVIHEWSSVDDPYLELLITPQMKTSLQHLDLSNCAPISDGSALLQLQNLKTLILYNVPKLQLALENICKMTELRYLDISTSNDRYGQVYKQPNEQLSTLVTSLPHLTHLDISGTNLAGPRNDHIPGLKPLKKRKLDYLGLYNTANEAAYRSHIPAVQVAGDATEDQILTACEMYIDRVEFLRRTLNDLFHCFRFETNFHDVNRALDVVLLSMSRHVNEKQIQIAASASLFYIVKTDEAKHHFNIKIKREIITRLLDAMQIHRYDTTMLRNGSLTLIHFRMPQDVIFEYPRLVNILLLIVTNDEDDFIQRLGIYLLNSLACQVDGQQKMLVGDLGAIDKMLALIKNRLERRVCDEVLETAWSTMWNVTDETPVNCQRFLDNSGMKYFTQCMDAFPQSSELLRNMMGLLGNVAECAHLRIRLMEADYIERFSDLLSSDSDGIEVSYNAAGILSHIASDGEEHWNRLIPDCERHGVLKRMNQAIGRWKINSKRNINYRSFEPILRLLTSWDITAEAQYWAVWALTNLTRVYSQKYCPLLIEDKGVEVLQNLLKNPNLPSHIRQLTTLTLKQVDKWTESGDLARLEESEELDIPD